MSFIRSYFTIIFSLACVLALLSSLTFFLPVKNSSPVDVEIEPKNDKTIFQEGFDLSAYLKKNWNDYQSNLSRTNYTHSSPSPFLDTDQRSISKQDFPEEVGALQSFYVISENLEPVTESAKLVKISDNLYIYVRDDYADSFSSEELTYLSDQFENTIFPTETSIFGDTDGILGDVDNNSHITLYLTELPAFVAGYFDPGNEFASTSEGNAREMVYVDISLALDATDLSDKFSVPLSVFAHEFQHLIHFNHDPYEHYWVDEGLAELAVDLVGYNSVDLLSLDLYLSHSDNSLFLWDFNNEANQNLADYSASYLFFRYLADRYGHDFLSILVNNSRLGAKGVQSSLNIAGQDYEEGILGHPDLYGQVQSSLNAEGQSSVEFFSLFHDWVMSLHLNDKLTPYSISMTNKRLDSQSLSFSSDGKLEIQGDVVLSGVDAYNVSNFKSDTLLSISNTGDTLLSLRTYSYKKEFNSSESPLTYQTIGVQPGDTLTHYIPHSGTNTLYFHISGMSDSLFAVPNHYRSTGVGTPSEYSLNFQQAQLDYVFDINDSLTIDEEKWMLQASNIKISSTSTNDDIGDVYLHIVDNRFNVDKIVQLVYNSDSMEWSTDGIISVQSLDPGNYTLQIVASDGSKYGSQQFSTQLEGILGHPDFYDTVQQFSTQLAVTHKVLGASIAISEGSLEINSETYYEFFVTVNYTQTGNSTYLYNGVGAYFYLTPSGSEDATYFDTVIYSLDNQTFSGHLPLSIISSPVDLHFYLLFDSDELVQYKLLTNYSVDINIFRSILPFHTSFVVVPFLAIFLGISILYIRKNKK